ncbi:MAG: FxsA family protein [Solirubrobacterales bacterium]
MGLLIALFIVVPIVELYVIIEIGGLIGVLPTIALLLADAMLGALLLRHQGRGAWRRFNDAIAERRFPGREVADGVMIAIGGTLLLTPGFITDIFGLLLLIPPTRAIVRRVMRSYFTRRFVMVDLGDRMSQRRDSTGRPYDFDSTADEVEPVEPRLRGGPDSGG